MNGALFNALTTPLITFCIERASPPTPSDKPCYAALISFTRTLTSAANFSDSSLISRASSIRQNYAALTILTWVFICSVCRATDRHWWLISVAKRTNTTSDPVIAISTMRNGNITLGTIKLPTKRVGHSHRPLMPATIILLLR